jgi:hypothetical protein
VTNVTDSWMTGAVAREGAPDNLAPGSAGGLVVRELPAAAEAVATRNIAVGAALGAARFDYSALPPAEPGATL